MAAGDAGKSWGVRSTPEIDSRYPIWDQPNFIRDVDEGRFYLPDAEEGKRETFITSVIDAKPIQCLRIPGPSYITLLAAVFTGGIFIFSTFKLWWWMAASAVVALAMILRWCWTATAVIPEKDEKYVGHGLTLPLYCSGSDSVGWWAMLITMLADFTAFASLVFGYFFYWTLKQEFPPVSITGPGVQWPSVGLLLLLAAWVMTLLARRWNKTDRTGAFYAGMTLAVLLAIAGSGALVTGPMLSRMDPAEHVYSATVWLLVIWTVLHAVVGVVMQLYCVARRVAGRMTGRYDIDIQNVALYWHFVAITVAVTVTVIAGFPSLT